MIFTALVTTAVASTVYNLYQGDKITAQAKEKSLKAMNRAYENNVKANQQIEIAKTSMLRLANRKKAILMTTIPQFIELYEKLKKINFTKGEGIIELEAFAPEIIEDMNMQTKTIGSITTDAEAATYLTVTGAASGLALIAGGVAASGFVAAVALPAFASYSIKKDAEGKMREADQIAKQSRLQSAHSANISLSYSAIEKRADKITDVLTKLNLMLRKSIAHTEVLINEKGNNKANYTFEDRKDLAVCINLVKAVKDILDVPLLDENGEISKASLEAIEIGNTYLDEVQGFK